MSSLFLISVVALQAVSARTFRCDEVFANASASNKPAECFEGDHASKVIFDGDHVGQAILTLVPIIIFALGLLLCPIMTAARYCCGCCGGYRRRPDGLCCGASQWDQIPEPRKNKAYTRGSIRRTKFCSCILLICAAAAIPVGIAGAARFQTNFDDIFSEVKSVLTWVDGRSNGMRTLLTINATGELIPPLTEELFQDIGKKTIDIRASIQDAKDQVDPFVGETFIGAVIIFALSIMFLLATIGAACANLRRCVLCCNLVFHYLFFILYSIIAVVFLAAGLLVTDVCGERQLFLNNPSAKGLISLAGVPQCDANFPFERIPGQVTDVIRTQSIAACESMDSICSPGTTFDSSQPLEVFQCTGLTNATQDCETFASANGIASSMELKPSAPGVQCVNDSVVLTPCTLSKCGETCNDATIKNTSQTASTSLSYAANAELAYTVYVQPLLSCRVIYKEMLAPLKSCDPFVDSMFMIGGSALAMQVVFALGIMLLWRGQKRFFDSAEAFNSEDDGAELSFDDVLAQKAAAGESYEAPKGGQQPF
jgi:hypothetical protein